MAESIEEIRQRKAREMLTAMAINDEEKQKELMDMLPWSFRIKTDDYAGANQFVEVLQRENVVCITADVQFADMIVEMLNRADLIQQAGLVSEEE